MKIISVHEVFKIYPLGSLMLIVAAIFLATRDIDGMAAIAVLPGFFCYGDCERRRRNYAGLGVKR